CDSRREAQVDGGAPAVRHQVDDGDRPVFELALDLPLARKADRAKARPHVESRGADGMKDQSLPLDDGEQSVKSREIRKWPGPLDPGLAESPEHAFPRPGRNAGQGRSRDVDGD